jgi:hypothetical protein
VGHLNERTYGQLLAGDLPAGEARELARHLEDPCDVCESFLASPHAADAADGRVERALGALAAEEESGGDDLEFQRIMRRVDQDAAAPTRRRTAPARWLAAVAAGAIVAGAAGVILHARQPERPGWDGEKGTAVQGIPLRLGFLVVSTARGGAPDLEKGVSGQVVDAAASLQFEVELGRAAQVALVRVPPGGSPEVFFREALPKGRTTISVSGRPAAYPLAELAGSQRFVAVASAERLEPAQLERAAAAAPAARGGAPDAALEGLSLDAVEVTVR